MPTQPMLVTPGISVDENGVESYDIENSVVQVGNYNSGEITAPYQEDDATGNRVYEHETIEDFTQEEYVDAEDQLVSGYLELFPQLPDALEWGADFYPPEVLDNYNKAVDSGDWEYMSPFIEQLIADYAEHGTAPTPIEEQQEQVEEQAQISDEEIDAAFQLMTGGEPEGAETAYAFMEAAVEVAEEHPCLSEMFSLTSQFHRGDVTAEEAINDLVGKYPTETIAYYYRYMMESDS